MADYKKLKINIIILSCFLSMFFSSCNNNEKSKIVIPAKTKEEIKQDSIHKQEESIVFGNIKFGINKDEFEKAKDEFEEKCKGENYGKYIGDYQFSYINGYYYEAKLYYVEVVGREISYESYERRMPVQFEALLNVLKNKYGPPYPENKLPPWHLMDKGNKYYLAEWYNLGDKKMNMVVDCKGGDYTLNIIIYKPSISEIISKEREVEEQNAIKKGVEVL